MVASATKFTENLGGVLKRHHAPHDRAKIFQELNESLDNGEISMEDISLRELFEQCVRDGHRLVKQLRPGEDSTELMESDAVKSSDFQKITTLAISSTLLKEYELATVSADMLSTTYKTNLKQERMAGLSTPGDAGENIPEGMPYPLAGIAADYIDLPQTEKSGFIVPVTKEAVFFDQTGQLLQRCRDVAKWEARSKLKDIIACVVGVTNNYRYMDVDYQTFQANGKYWTNLLSGNAFTNWKSIDAVEQLRSQMRDPLNGELIEFPGKPMAIGATSLKPHFNRVFGATEVRHVDGGITTISNNPVGSEYTSFTHPLIAEIQGNSDDWLVGDPKEQVTYVENWGITTQTAGAGSEADFTNDIVMRVKTSRRGVAAVTQPRAMVKSTP